MHLRPQSYDDARVVGEHLRDGAPVVMDLSAAPDDDARRMVAFAAGLAFGLRGSLERTGDQQYRLAPESEPF